MDPLLGEIPKYSLAGLTSCEADLHDLLQQIDIMVTHRKQMWERQNQELKAQLQAREADLIHSRIQVRNLQQQAAVREQAQREVASGYQEHLDWLHVQLEKLKDGYDRLMRRRGRQAEQETDVTFESRALSRKLEEFQSKAKEWEEQRASSQKELALLEANRRSLAARCCQLLQVHQPQPCQVSTSFQEDLSAGCPAEEVRDGELAELRAELKEAREEVHTKEAALAQLKEDVDAAHVERERLLQELESEHTQRQASEAALCELKAELQNRDELQEATELEARTWQKETRRLREQLLESERKSRLEEAGGRRAASAELLKLRQQVERMQSALQATNQQEALLLPEGIITTLTGLESSHSITVQLQDTLQRTEKELHAREHAEILKSPEVAKVHAQCPPGSEVARSSEPGSERWPCPEALHITAYENQLSTCWEHTEAGDPPLLSISSTTPEDWPGCHGNSQKGEEPAELGGVSIALDTLDFQDGTEQGCSLRSSQVQRFLQEEERRMRTLEQQLDSHVHELHSSTLGTLRKCSFCRLGNGRTLPSLTATGQLVACCSTGSRGSDANTFTFTEE